MWNIISDQGIMGSHCNDSTPYFLALTNLNGVTCLPCRAKTSKSPPPRAKPGEPCAEEYPASSDDEGGGSTGDDYDSSAEIR
jgi:hypothetical protein